MFKLTLKILHIKCYGKNEKSKTKKTKKLAF